MRQIESLNGYYRRPEAMENYIKYNNWHFNKKLCEWAVGRMEKENAATGKTERITPWTKDEVEEMLKKHGVKLENVEGYDHVYVANMAKADFLGKSIPDEAHVALHVKCVVDDVDQRDGFIFNRFYADCVNNGVPVPWDDVL